MRGILKQPFMNLPLKSSVNDVSINGNNPTNTSVTSATGMFGESAGAYEWNAGSDRLSWSSSIGNQVAIKINTGSTISFYINASNPSVYKFIFSQYSASGGNRAYQIMLLNTSGAVNVYRFGTSGANAFDTPSNSFVANTWQLCQVTTIENGSNIDAKIYINGIEKATGTIAKTPEDSNYELRIGAEPNNNDSFIGKMTDFRIYPSKLSNFEMALLSSQKGRLVA